VTRMSTAATAADGESPDPSDVSAVSTAYDTRRPGSRFSSARHLDGFAESARAERPGRAGRRAPGARRWIRPG
jgi:hypothetical protein